MLLDLSQKGIFAWNMLGKTTFSFIKALNLYKKQRRVAHFLLKEPAIYTTAFSRVRFILVA